VLFVWTGRRERKDGKAVREWRVRYGDDCLGLEQ
jgi:hypothetical protein